MQLFYNLSDPSIEDSLYEIESMRHFAGLTLTDRTPDETTILNFHHLLEKEQLGRQLFEEINSHLREFGMLLKEGSIGRHYIKRVFGYDKVRYRRLAKNTERLCLPRGSVPEIRR